jgi:glycine/D-amino acid oxidase-like deaminating enzyme
MAKTTWLEDIPFKNIYAPLASNIEVDIVIIGAGIAGTTAAYQLRSLGKKVALIEKGLIAQQSVTSFTTGFLSMFADNGLTDTTKSFGARNAKLVWQSQQSAIEEIAKIVNKETIECEFVRCSEFFYSNNNDQAVDLKEESQLAQKMGFDVEFKIDNTLNFPNSGYMEVKNQAKFHSTKYIKNLVKIASQSGIQVFENTEITEIKEEKKLAIKAGKFTVIANKIFVATHDPIYNPLKIYSKKGLYQTYLIELEIKKGLFKEATYDDEDNPYHYFRVDSKPEHDRMIIGGEDHRQDIKVPESKNYQALKQYLNQLMGDRPYKIIKKWNGPIIEPVDGLPLIGWANKTQNIYIATAFSGTGMTFGTLSGMMFKTEIMKEKNPYQKIYDPNRIPSIKQLWGKGIDYTEELIGGAATNIFK